MFFAWCLRLDKSPVEPHRVAGVVASCPFGSQRHKHVSASEITRRSTSVVGSHVTIIYGHSNMLIGYGCKPYLTRAR